VSFATCNVTSRGRKSEGKTAVSPLIDLSANAPAI
jgi:hypothetical protein